MRQFLSVLIALALIFLINTIASSHERFSAKTSISNYATPVNTQTDFDNNPTVAPQTLTPKESLIPMHESRNIKPASFSSNRFPSLMPSSAPSSKPSIDKPTTSFGKNSHSHKKKSFKKSSSLKSKQSTKTDSENNDLSGHTDDIDEIDQKSRNNPKITTSTLENKSVDIIPSSDVKSSSIQEAIRLITTTGFSIGNFIGFRQIKSIDVNSPSYPLTARRFFAIYLIATQSLYYLLKYLITRRNDLTEVELTSSLSSLQNSPFDIDSLTQALPAPLRGLLGSVSMATRVKRSTTISTRDYDLQQLNFSFRTMFYEVLLGSGLLLLYPSSKVVWYIMMYGLGWKVQSPIFNLHVLRLPAEGELKRPFQNRMLRGLGAGGAEDSEIKGVEDDTVIEENPIVSDRPSNTSVALDTVNDIDDDANDDDDAASHDIETGASDENETGASDDENFESEIDKLLTKTSESIQKSSE